MDRASLGRQIKQFRIQTACSGTGAAMLCLKALAESSNASHQQESDRSFSGRSLQRVGLRQRAWHAARTHI
eukprot:6487509-Amphidinium_carterae.1